jgi:tetratricopeptide (TPR) repeat protein
VSSYQNIIIVLIILIFTGCSNSTQTLEKEKKRVGTKTFELEDVYIMQAIECQRAKDINCSRSIYEKLYKESGKKHYLIGILKNDLLLNNINNLKDILSDLEDEDIEHFSHNNKLEFYRLLVQIYLKQNDIDNALVMLEKLLKIDKNSKVYTMIANIYIIKKDYKKAITYLESAYSFEHDEQVLLKIVSLFYHNLNEKKKAISYLESHIRLYEFSTILAEQLLRIYAEDLNIAGMIEVYKALYNNENNFHVSQRLKNIYLDKISQLYMLKNDLKSFIKFLEENNVRDERLLEAYHASKDIEKAQELAKELYEQTKSYEMLAKWAIFEYEAKKDNKTNEFIKKITNRLEKALTYHKSATFYNYLGYLLIDHEIDIKKGLYWIEKSIEIDNKSPFYLDSLAWAYYKLERYKEAFDIMKKVVEITGTEDSEIKKHWELIQESYNKINTEEKIVKTEETLVNNNNVIDDLNTTNKE